MLTGCKRITIQDTYFLSVAYDGLKNSSDHGNGRTARGILGTVFPSTSTEADAIQDITIQRCYFINEAADQSLIDADAVCFQGNSPASIPHSRIRMEDNFVYRYGWRGGKFQISGVKASGNRIISTTPQAYGVAAGDGYFRTMRNGFLFQGSNNEISDNKFLGTSMGSAIDIQSTDTAGFGQCTNNIVGFNTVSLDGTLEGLAYIFNFESIDGGQIVGNSWNCGYNGILLRGDCKRLALAANRGASNIFAAVYLLRETQANTWTNMAPSDCTIIGTVADSSAAWGVNASAGTNIATIGTTGTAASGLVTYASGVTGSRVGNKGSIEPLQASTANANYYALIEAFADATLSAKMTLAFGNIAWSYRVDTDTWTLGRANNNASGAWGFNQAPDASAQVAINSTTKGLLLPRMTKAQRNAIGSPANGLAVYQTDSTPGIRLYEDGAWNKPTVTADP